MPCDSSYMEPNRSEQNSITVRTLLKEVGFKIHVGPYGQVATLDRDVRAHCQWCKANKSHIRKCSLELQIWWRDHQKADAAKAVESRRRAERSAARERALKKLTKEELDAIRER